MATAYTVDGTTADGHQTRPLHTVAADPAVLPLGTRIRVKGAGPYSGTYVVHDTGPRIIGRHIDIFMDDPATAKSFGKKLVMVKVVARVHAARSTAMR